MAKVYLLTWNPEQAEAGGNSIFAVGDNVQWSSHSNRPKIGDTVFMMRVGQWPKGIIAKGVVTEQSFDGPYWANPEKTWRYIKFRVEAVRPDCSSGLLPLLLLERFNDRFQTSFRWTPITSGVEVPEVLAAELVRQWDLGANMHSLRQTVEWMQQDKVNSRRDWLKDYKGRIAEARHLTETKAYIDDEALEWIWAPPANGVCGVSPGFLSKEAFEQNRDWLRELTNLIRSNPSEETHRQVFAAWGNAVKENRFSKTYQVVINRVFATFAPERYTTVVNPDNCRLILQCFNREFGLDAFESDNWPQQNESILSQLQLIGVDGSKVAENNVAMWQVCDALALRNKSNAKDSDAEVPVVKEERVMPRLDNVPLNRIYYGPPGTGKTFITMEAAVRAAEPDFKWGNRDELKAKYKALSDDGRIVFVTFHQSYSYEDFVEGLTANSDSGQIQYAPKNGVFKKLVQKAKDKQLSGLQRVSTSFDRCWELFLQQLSENVDGVTIITRRTTFLVTEVDDNTIRFDKSGGDSVHSLSVSTLQALFNQQRVLKGGLQPYYDGLINHLKALGEQLNDTAVSHQNFVLIIDEINRGNISRIFGELITLIEPSKRLGGSEPLEVVLPLTGDKFSVPDNLYIIGTMNTADRSLAGLDLALRRRFDFIEMLPQPEMLRGVEIEGVNFELMLSTMNERISVLLDKDHCIGHASFMHLHPDYRPAEMPKKASLTELGCVFKHKVLPLLQEYFFEDWQRIVWVLNNQNKATDIAFIRKASGKPIPELFKGVTQIKARDRWEINQAAFTQAESYKLIYQDEAVTE